MANTIRYRRRKGTLALLELLANDAAGWLARAVEFYKLLGLTQAINHPRPTRGRTVDLREETALDRLEGPFDELARTVDVRRITSHRTRGRYNIPAVGLFVWRLKAYTVTRTPAYCREEAGAHCYTFSVLGNDTPLYTRPKLELDPRQIAGELNLPIPIRRRAFEARKAHYYGTGKSLEIQVGNSHEAVPSEQIVPANLAGWHYRPGPGQVAVDPELGRIAFHPRHLPKGGVWVSYNYGFSADIGGGEYDRPLLQPTERLVFGEDDFKDPAGLADKLRHPPDHLSLLSGYLREQFSGETKQLLEEYHAPDPLSEALRKALTDEANQLLRGGSLYDRERFQQVSLSGETRQLIEQDPRGRDLIHLNRLLLEQAYPDDVAKSFALYRVGSGQTLKSIKEALDQWSDEKPRHAIVEIADSGVYVEQIDISLGRGQNLQIRAANRCRPVIRLLDWYTDRPDALSVKGERGSRFTLDGLLVSGRGVQIEGELASVTIRHSTLVPGWALHHDCEPRRPAEPSLQLFNTPRVCINVDHSITGSIQSNQDEVQTDPIRLRISDSILDATSLEHEALGAPDCLVAHVRLTVARSTVFGQVQVHAIDLAENSIFDGQIKVARRQWGCMRFCYLTMPGSRTPRRYNCQPDLVEQIVKADPKAATDAEKEAALQRERDRVRPRFNGVRYGTPTYCQLAEVCAEEIKRGADDESEMGVFHDLFQPQREANLRVRLDEYAPAGMEAGIIFAS